LLMQNTILAATALQFADRIREREVHTPSTADEAPKRDRFSPEFRRKLVYFSLMVEVFIDMLGLGIITPMLPTYAAEMLTGKTQSVGLLIGLLFSGYALVRIFALPFFGAMSDRVGKRKLFILFGLGAYTLTSIGYVLADSYAALLTVRLIQGFSSAMVFPMVMAYVGELSPDGREGAHMGPITSASFIGMGTGPLVGGMISDLFDAKYVFLAMGVMAIISFSLIYFFVPERVPSKKKASRKGMFRAFLLNRTFSGILLYRFINAFLRGGFMAFIPLLIASLYHMSTTEVGIILACNTVLVGLLQTPFGRLADRFNNVSLVMYGNFIAAGALILLPVTGGLWGMIAAASVLGIGSALSISSAMAMTLRMGKDVNMIGSSMSMFAMAMSVGLVFSPLVAGEVNDSALGIVFVFPINGTIAVLGTIVVYFLIRNYRPASAEQSAS